MAEEEMHLPLSDLKKQVPYSSVLLLVLEGNAKFKCHEVCANAPPATFILHLHTTNSWNSV